MAYYDIDGCWRMIQNCRADQSAHFLNTIHRLVVAVYIEGLVPSQPWLYVGKLKDERVDEELVNRLSGDLGGSG